MPPYQTRLKLARLTFILAIILYAIAQLQPFVSNGWPIWRGWSFVVLGLNLSSFSDSELKLTGIAMLPAIFTLFLLVAPFLCTFFSKARPLLWVARVFITGVTLGFGYCIQHVIVIMLGPKEYLLHIAIGSYLLYAAMALVILGLFLIPKAGTQQS